MMAPNPPMCDVNISPTREVHAPNQSKSSRSKPSLPNHQVLLLQNKKTSFFVCFYSKSFCSWFNFCSYSTWNSFYSSTSSRLFETPPTDSIALLAEQNTGMDGIQTALVGMASQKNRLLLRLQILTLPCCSELPLIINCWMSWKKSWSRLLSLRNVIDLVVNFLNCSNLVRSQQSCQNLPTKAPVSVSKETVLYLLFGTE